MINKMIKLVESVQRVKACPWLCLGYHLPGQFPWRTGLFQKNPPKVWSQNIEIFQRPKLLVLFT